MPGLGALLVALTCLAPAPAHAGSSVAKGALAGEPLFGAALPEAALSERARAGPPLAQPAPCALSRAGAEARKADPIAARSAATQLAGGETEPARSEADPTRGLPLPPGSRSAEERPGTFLSSRGFRDTVEFFEAALDRRGEAYRKTPVQRLRGVTLARFLAEESDARWGAVQVYELRGSTYIAVIAPLDRAHRPR